MASDVSQGGLFIETRRPLEVGSEVRLRLERKDASVELPGTVARVREAESPDQPAGMGISFGELQSDQRQALATLVQELAVED